MVEDRLAEEYFSLPFEELAKRAALINAPKRPVRAAPTIVEERCTTSPPCRHCKWEYFKVRGIQSGRRKSIPETIEWAKHLQSAGIGRTFIASGWMGYEVPPDFLAHVQAVREQTSMEVYGLFGALSRKSLLDLQAAGLQGYLCGLESPSEEVYRLFRPGGDSLADRLRALEWAAELGLKIWSGFLVGFGESGQDVVTGLEHLRRIQPSSVSILPFTPFPHTAMQGSMPANPLQWARAAAAATLLFPEADIFTDQAAGLYRPYSDMFMPNGVYEVPTRQA